MLHGAFANPGGIRVTEVKFFKSRSIPTQVVLYMEMDMFMYPSRYNKISNVSLIETLSQLFNCF